jgi:hypothetical protein
LVAHAAILGALYLVPAKHGSPPEGRTVAAVEPLEDFDVEIERALYENPTLSPRAEEANVRPNAPHAGVAVAAMSRAMTPDPGGVSPAPERPAGAPDEGWSFDVAKPSALVSPSVIAEALRPDATPTTEPPRTGVSSTGGVAEGLDAHDASIGLGRGGPVLSALEAAAAGRDAPTEGKASFDVTIDTQGHVAVSLVAASVNYDAWERVGLVMRGAMDPKLVRIPPGARGWHVVAEIEAKIQYPNSADPKKMGTTFRGESLHLVENKHRVAANDPPIIFKDRPPGLWLHHAGKVCSVDYNLLTPWMVSGGCDPANIGAHTMRVVHGRVVSEGRL